MKRYHFTEISSTNDLVKQLLKDNDKIIVTADKQTKGRGRNGKEWFGDFGKNIYLSYGLKHKEKLKIEKISLMQVIGAVATKETLAQITKFNNFILKYPNDVLIKSKDKIKKIAGVISEHSFMGEFCTESVIGIGINVNQNYFNKDLKEKATSLYLENINTDIDILTNLLIDNITKYININEIELFEKWKKDLNIENKIIQLIDSNDRFKIEKINKNCTLTAKNLSDNSIKIIDNGDSIKYE